MSNNPNNTTTYLIIRSFLACTVSMLICFITYAIAEKYIDYLKDKKKIELQGYSDYSIQVLSNGAYLIDNEFYVPQGDLEIYIFETFED